MAEPASLLEVAAKLRELVVQNILEGTWDAIFATCVGGPLFLISFFMTQAIRTAVNVHAFISSIALTAFHVQLHLLRRLTIFLRRHKVTPADKWVLKLYRQCCAEVTWAKQESWAYLFIESTTPPAALPFKSRRSGAYPSALGSALGVDIKQRGSANTPRDNVVDPNSTPRDNDVTPDAAFLESAGISPLAGRQRLFAKWKLESTKMNTTRLLREMMSVMRVRTENVEDLALIQSLLLLMNRIDIDLIEDGLGLG